MRPEDLATAPHDADADPLARIGQALDLVAAIEREEVSLPSSDRPHEFLVHERAARRKDATGPGSHLLPQPLRTAWQEEARPQTTASVAAETVVLAKFDLGRGVKLRAHYPGKGLTLAAQPIRPDGRSGVDNVVRAHVVVGRHAPFLIPPMVAHGTVLTEGTQEPGSVYLVERWVEGTPLMRGTALAEALPAVLAGLATLWAGHGVRRVAPSQLWRERLAVDWHDLRGGDVLPGPTWRRVRDLVRQDRRLRVSWTHGDPVASNILRTDDGVVLIDWEHSKEAPIMYDAAKLHLFTADPDAALDVVLSTAGTDLGDPAGPKDLDPAEELALVHARYLSRYPRRRASLEGHPRLKVYEQQARRQAQRLQEALERAGG